MSSAGDGKLPQHFHKPRKKRPLVEPSVGATPKRQKTGVSHLLFSRFLVFTTDKNIDLVLGQGIETDTGEGNIVFDALSTDYHASEYAYLAYLVPPRILPGFPRSDVKEGEEMIKGGGERGIG